MELVSGTWVTTTHIEEGLPSTNYADLLEDNFYSWEDQGASQGAFPRSHFATLEITTQGVCVSPYAINYHA